MIEGIIIKALSGFYYVYDGEKVYETRARGIMRKNGVTPLVGDSAVIQLESGSAVLDKVLPRNNALIRPPVANVDRLYIISSHTDPAPNTLIIDKLIGQCETKGIEPIIVFNKCDMGSFTEYEYIYLKSGFEVHTVSCLTGEGIDKLKASFGKGISVLTGNSGVGKSSLLNAMFDGFNLKTGEVSTKLGRGRHTTRHSELFANGNGGFIADTPGFATVDSERITKDKVAFCFREFSDFIDDCKFTTCSHTCEKGCAVIEAVKLGKICKSRHESYCAIYKDCASLNEWELK